MASADQVEESDVGCGETGEQQEIFAAQDLIRVPAAERNKGPILEVLQEVLLPKKGFVLEVASGPGQHVVHFAKQFPNLTFQPSDCDVSYLKRGAVREQEALEFVDWRREMDIQAYIHKTRLSNILQPLYIDITQPVSQWPQHDRFQPQSHVAVLNINMVHISPWDTCQGLMNATGHLLKPGGHLYMYGPFAVNGVLSPDSNVQFDRMLRSRNSTWGVRDIADIKQLADQHGLTLEKLVDMPANNKSLIFIKR